MAMRENTGLQIALILFVMIVVVLAVTNYVTFTKMQEAYKQADAQANNAATEKRVAEGLITENEKLRKFLGYKVKLEGGPEVPQIETNYNKDMSLFAAEYEQKDYRALPQFLVGEIVKLKGQLVKANGRADTLMAQVDQARKEEQTNVAKYAGQQKDQADELAKLTVDFKTRREETVTQADELQARLDDSAKREAALKASKDKEVDALAQRIAKLDLLKKQLTEKLDSKQPTAGAERPDGKVTWVSQRGGSVYINLGSADGLRRSTTFTVMDANALNVATAEPKASVEVTTIRGPHLAEARIIEDQLSNPILTGDMIYSPVWNPGQKTHFALIGFMDIDNDGKSDRQMIRTLIQMNGGTVDAEVTDDGDRQGKLTINTRYLVRGNQPTDKTKPEALQAYSNMLKEAGDLGIEMISVERLLSDMGWRGSERTVDLQSGVSGGEFKPEPKSTDPSTPGFQQRTRPGGQTRRGSAY